MIRVNFPRHRFNRVSCEFFHLRIRIFHEFILRLLRVKSVEIPLKLVVSDLIITLKSLPYSRSQNARTRRPVFKPRRS